MPYCKNCGAEVKETAKFCPKCGTERRASVAKEEKRIKLPQDKRMLVGGIIAICIICIGAFAILNQPSNEETAITTPTTLSTTASTSTTTTSKTTMKTTTTSTTSTTTTVKALCKDIINPLPKPDEAHILKYNTRGYYYSEEFPGYEFYIKYSLRESNGDRGYALDVRKPDGIGMSTKVTESADAVVDSIHLRLGCSSDGKDVVIYVWEASKQYMDLDVTGNVKDEPISVTVKDRVTGEPISNAKVKVSWSGMSIQG